MNLVAHSAGLKSLELGSRVSPSDLWNRSEKLLSKWPELEGFGDRFTWESVFSEGAGMAPRLSNLPSAGS